MTSQLGECLDYPPLGSVSTATMRPEDLIPAFLSVLEEYRPREARKLTWQYRKLVNTLNRGWYYVNRMPVDCDSCFGQVYVPECMEDQASWLLEDLFEALDSLSAPYVSFGAHERDGADYGFWVDWCSVESCLDDERILRIPDHWHNLTPAEVIAFSGWRTPRAIDPICLYVLRWDSAVDGTADLYDAKTGKRIWSV